MNYDTYRTFLELALTRNFSTTAKKLNIVQSTVSNRIRELENYMGHQLFIRNNKSVELTEAGKRLIPYCRRLLSIEAEALETLGQSGIKYQVNIGTVHSMYPGFLKQMVTDFIRDHDDVSVRIMFNHTDRIIQQFSDDLVDVGIITHLPKSGKLEKIRTLDDSIILTAKNSPAFKESLLPHELRQQPFLKTDLVDAFENRPRETIGSPLEYRLYLDQIHEIVDFIRMGFGYAFVLKSIAAPHIESGDIKEVKIRGQAPFALENHIIVNANKMHQDGLVRFVRAIKCYSS